MACSERRVANEARLTTIPRQASSAHPVDVVFEDLYLEHRETVVHFLRAYCHDDDEAMDLAALTFERALVALRGPGLTGPPLPWLLRVARNAAIDRHRRQGTRRRLLSALAACGSRPGSAGKALTARLLRIDRLGHLLPGLRGRPLGDHGSDSVTFGQAQPEPLATGDDEVHDGPGHRQTTGLTGEATDDLGPPPYFLQGSFQQVVDSTSA